MGGRGRHPEKRLTAVTIRNAKPGTRLCDGNGLYLDTAVTGARYWILRTVVKGKRRSIGLGNAALVSLAEAREEARRLRAIARRGRDPFEQKERERQVVPTFAEAAREFHAINSKTFDERHANRWIVTLEQYAFPALGARSIDTITPADVLKVLTPIWLEIPDTAKRIKQRMRAVFGYAKAQGYLSGDNPADDVTKVLPRQPATGGHHAALPYAQVPDFIQALREADAALSVRLAFEFTILTAVRTREALLAQWDQIDVETKVWTIPGEQMKGKGTEKRFPHRVPLGDRCMEILRQAKELPGDGRYIFPGRSHAKPLSNMAFLQCLKRMGRSDITAHGFRSSFRDWAEERNMYQHNVIEKCLAHRLTSKVEESYLRSDLLELRRPLMDSWAAYATAAPRQKVVKIREA